MREPDKKLSNKKFEEYRRYVAEIRSAATIPDRFAYCILDLMDILKEHGLVDVFGEQNAKDD